MRTALLVLLVGLLTTPSSQQLPSFRSTAIGVNVPVFVRKNGQAVGGLKKHDFELTDNGVPQDITAVDGEALRLDVTVVVQETELVEGSAIRTFIPDVEAFARSLPPGDLVRVILAGDDLRERDLPITEDLIAAAQRESRCRPVYDALATALIRLAPPDRQRVVVLFSVSEGSGSFGNADTIAEVAKRSNTILYVVPLERPVGATMRRSHIARSVCPLLELDWSPARRSILGKIEGVSNPDDQLRQLERASQNRLAELAKYTGGREVRPSILARSAQNALRDALAEIRSGYVLRYMPAGVPDGGWHTIEVKLRSTEPLDVRARPGYWR